MEARPDGVFLERFDEAGNEAGDTWHESIGDAKAQARMEYGDAVGAWTETPDSCDDPVAYAIRLARTEADWP